MLRQILRPILKRMFGLLFRVRVAGDLNQFKAGRLLIIANHESFMDGLVLGLFLPVDPVFVVHTYVTRHRWFRLIMRLADHVAVDPTSPMAMKRVIKLIDSGRPVMVFPEGRITTTGSLMKVYDGPAFAAARTGATIVPVRLDGPARSYFSRLSGQQPRCLLPRITVSIQAATSLPLPEAPTARQRRRKAGEGMRRIMQAMVFHSEPKQTLYQGLIEAMAIFGRRRPVAEDMKGIEYTYGEILKMALALGRQGSRLGWEDERLGLLLPNLVATLAMVIGLGAFRRTPAMLNYTAGKDGVRNACAVAKVRTIITSRAFVETAKLGELINALSGLRVVYLEELGFGFVDKLWVAVAARFPHWIGQGISPEAVAVVLFTSGSEAQPKGVALSHRAILSNIAQVRAVIDFGAEDKFFNALPIFHAFGLTAGGLLPLLTGPRIFLYPTPLHYRIIPEIIYDRSCTVLFGTSTFLHHYGRFAHPYDFYRLRHVVAGAERLSETVRSLWYEKFGIRLLEGYGATETAPVLAVNTPMAFRTGTVGQLLPGIEAKLLPVPGIERGGLLHVRGPNLLSGYYRATCPGVLDPPHAEALGDGWYNTGDICELDENGFLCITGRLKRFAKVAGEMVSLETVEAIATTTSQAQHAAVSQADLKRGEAIVLFTTDKGLTWERLKAAAQRLGQPELAVPRRVLPIDTLPLLGTGKVDYVKLKQMAEAV